MSIKHVIFDCDGTLTDGHVVYGSVRSPHMATNWIPLRSRTFYIPDGHGIINLRQRGIEVVIISSENDEHIVDRAHKLGCKAKLGVKEKEKIYSMLGINPDECAYMGDDVNDLPAMKLAKIVACPYNVNQEVLDYICENWLVAGKNLTVGNQIP